MTIVTCAHSRDTDPVVDMCRPIIIEGTIKLHPNHKQVGLIIFQNRTKARHVDQKYEIKKKLKSPRNTGILINGKTNLSAA